MPLLLCCCFLQVVPTIVPCTLPVASCIEDAIASNAKHQLPVGACLNESVIWLTAAGATLHAAPVDWSLIQYSSFSIAPVVKDAPARVWNSYLATVWALALGERITVWKRVLGRECDYFKAYV